MLKSWEFDVGELIRVTWDESVTLKAFTPIGGQWVEFDDLTLPDEMEEWEAINIAHGWAESLVSE